MLVHSNAGPGTGVESSLETLGSLNPIPCLQRQDNFVLPIPLDMSLDENKGKRRCFLRPSKMAVFCLQHTEFKLFWAKTLNTKN